MSKIGVLGQIKEHGPNASLAEIRSKLFCDRAGRVDPRLRTRLRRGYLFSQSFQYSSNYRPWTRGSAQPPIDIFQTSDQIQHFTATIWAAGRRAKVSTTGKRSRRINSTALIAGIQERAAPIRMRGLFHNLTAAGSPGTCREQCFTPRYVGNLARKFESTTIGAPDTGTLDRPIRERFVDLFDFPKQCDLFPCRWRSAFPHSFLIPRQYPISQK